MTKEQDISLTTSGLNLHGEPLPLSARYSGFERIGEIMDRLRLKKRSLEVRMGPAFDRTLSLELDAVLIEEEILMRVL